MWPLILAVLFIGVPILEIYVIIQVGQVIGAWWTVGLLLAEGFLGGWLVKREGRRAWSALQGAFRGGKLPNREVADAALILVGGTLLLAPGFVTDVFGFFMVLPFTRPLARRALTWVANRQVKKAVARRSAGAPGSGPTTVIQGEVLNGDQPPPR
ncbi:FxsA family protein [Tenggerimyces flavus]|uniref:FxsA family protein n=1 Tax=Tenggerimyces flavus TaxID=1708749 RepID=A0ABV7YF84_9ACTN|nr:FxsA family protein [Tenggerimyces flavus]MBM7788185.1 UPF0716 protein FxsA [Tenggerimyces flavus]